MKEKLSKMKLLDSLIAETYPLAEYEEAPKKKLITDLLSNQLQAKKKIRCSLSWCNVFFKFLSLLGAMFFKFLSLLSFCVLW